MPTITPLVMELTPTKTEPAIPVRVAKTRDVPRPAPANAPGSANGSAGEPLASPNADRPGIDRNGSGEEAPGTAASVKLSPQLSALARREQAHRQREQALKDREKAFETKLADADRFSALKAKLSAKDFSEIEALGLTYEEYTNYLLAKQNGEKPESQALKKFETELEELKKNQEESAERQFEETVSEYRKEISKLIASDPEFSSVKELKQEDAVLQLILDSWEEDDEELTVEQAAKDVEDFLVEQARRMTSIPKLKADGTPGEKRPLPPPRPGLRTLTQQVTTSTGDQRPQKSLQSLSESERYAEARRRALERRARETQNR